MVTTSFGIKISQGGSSLLAPKPAEDLSSKILKFALTTESGEPILTEDGEALLID